MKKKLLLILSFIVIVELQYLEAYPLTKSYSHIITKTISKNRSSGGGYFSVYYQISDKKGIKVLKTAFDSYQEALNSYTYSSALKEANLLIECKARYYNIPHCYGVKIVLLREAYRIGIVMQHLDGDLAVDKTDLYEDFDLDVGNPIINKFEELGIRRKDLHNENVIWYNNEWWVIDFHPGYVKINN